MSLTLPAEVTTEKNKISNKPIVLFIFDPILGDTYYVASQDYTIDGNTYDGLLNHGASMSFGARISELVSGIASVQSLTIELNDWQASIRGDWIGQYPLPDQTGTTVDVYIKYDTADLSASNMLQIYKGIVDSYEIHRDIMRISLKARLPGLAALPQNSVKATIVGSNKLSDPIPKPLQFGNLNRGDPRNWGDVTNHYFPCPFYYWDDNTKEARYWVADHEMSDMPSVANFRSYGGATNGGNAYSFVVRDNIYVQCAVEISTIYNAADGCYLIADHSSPYNAFAFLAPTAQGSGNSVSGWADAIDGSLSTTCTVNDGSPTLSVDTYGFGEMSENRMDADGIVGAWVNFGAITGTNSFQFKLTDGSTDRISSVIDSGNSNSWVNYATTFGTLNNIDDYYIQISQNTGGESCVVKNIVIGAHVQDISDSDEYLYIRAGGKEFSGTWNSRKTSGNLIEYIPDIIESILRDEYGYGDSDIDMDSFDAVYDYFQLTKFVISAGSIFKQKDGWDLLNEICKMFNLALIYNDENKWELVYPLKDVKSFEASGTDTPGNEDIFTDSETLSGGSYSNHPIKLKSFHLKRTSSNERYDILKVNCAQTHQGFTQLSTHDAGTGDHTITLDNYLLRDLSDADNFVGDLKDWVLIQKWKAEFETFWNGIGKQLGDIINIRHSELSSGIVATASMNTQKWMITSKDLNWRPNTIKISAIELY